MGIIEDEELRFGVEVLAGIGDVAQELLGVSDFQGDHIAGGQGDGVHVYGKERRGDDGRITGTHQRKAKVAEALFGPQADHDFFFRVEPDSVAAKVLASHFAAQVEDAVGLGVTVIAGIARRLGQFLDYVIGWRVGRIAHSQVDHIRTGAALLVKEGIDAAEHVGRESVDSSGVLDVEGLVVRCFGVLRSLGVGRLHRARCRRGIAIGHGGAIWSSGGPSGAARGGKAGLPL